MSAHSNRSVKKNFFDRSECLYLERCSPALDKLYAIKDYNAKGLIKGLIQRNETEYAIKLAKKAFFQTH